MPNPDLPAMNEVLPQLLLANSLQLSPCGDCLSLREQPWLKVTYFLEKPLPDNSSTQECDGLAISAQLGTTRRVHSSCRTPHGVS